MTRSMNKYEYSTERAVSDFSIQELAQGVLQILEEAPCLIQKEFTDSGEDVGARQVPLTYTVLSENKTGRQTSVILHDPGMGLITTFCNCNEFEADTFSCRHVTALLAAYLQKKHGIDCLKDPLLFTEMKKISGVEDPFLPGILKKTDARISALTKHRKASGKTAPVWLSQPKTEKDAGKSGRKPQNRMISLECVFLEAEDETLMELRVGAKRHFVIRDMAKLVKAYRTGASFAFAKSEDIPAGRAFYKPEDQPVMDFVAEIVEDAQRRQDLVLLFRDGYSEKRYLRLTGRDMDALMEILDGRSVKVKAYGTDDYSTYPVCLLEEPAPLELKKEEYGATLRVPEFIIIGTGLKYMYMTDSGRILRRDLSEWEMRKNLSVIHYGSPEYYIQQKDLPALCSNLEPLLSKEGQLVCQNFDLQEYLPETPQFRIYLDYPQQGMISCKLEAYYETQNKAYPVFDQKKNKTKRNLASEQPAGELIWNYFEAFEAETKMLFLECDNDGLYLFLTETIPALSAVGEVFISDALKKFKVRPAGIVDVGIQLESGKLLMSLTASGMSKQEMAELLSAYDSKKKYTKLKDGTFITVTPEEVSLWDDLADLYQSYGKRDPEAMRLPMFRALYLDEMLGKREEIRLQEGDSYQNLIRNMKSLSALEHVIPESLKEIMRPYQQDGVRWLKMLKNNGFGGILADDMGLGKTLQVLAFLLSEKEDGKSGAQLRTLVVAPASLIYNWKREIESFTPQLTCEVIAGTVDERAQMIGAIGETDCDVFITSYDLLKRDITAYDQVTFANEIIDEAQFIKNQNTQAAKGVRLVEAGFRLALTGTPVENRLSELWSIFDYLMPGFLYGYTRFRTEFEAPVVQQGNEVVMERLRRMVHPFILRRLKKDVLTELPEKLEEVVTVRLEGEQRRLYDARASRLRLYLDKQSEDEFRQNKLEILAELTKLRQICCGPELFLEDYHGGNAKLDACLELVRQAVEGGHKILLFSQFTTALDELGEGLLGAGLAYHRIDGSVSKEKRMQMVESFASDDVPVFCISLKAGGTGLNLTAADIVIHYDPWWNVAAQNQATDRAHRIGQMNTVTVYQLIAENTLEEQILNLQKSKARLAEDVLSGEGVSSIVINKEDLMGLL